MPRPPHREGRKPPWVALTVEKACAECEISEQGSWRVARPLPAHDGLAALLRDQARQPRPSLQGCPSPQGFNEPVQGKALPVQSGLASPTPWNWWPGRQRWSRATMGQAQLGPSALGTPEWHNPERSDSLA